MIFEIKLNFKRSWCNYCIVLFSSHLYAYI